MCETCDGAVCTDCCPSTECSADGCGVDGCVCCDLGDSVSCCCNAASCFTYISCDVCATCCSHRYDTSSGVYAQRRQGDQASFYYSSATDKPPLPPPVYVTAVPVAVPIIPTGPVQSV